MRHPYCTVIAAVETVTGIVTVALPVPVTVIAQVPAVSGTTVYAAVPAATTSTGATVATAPASGEQVSVSTNGALPPACVTTTDTEFGELNTIEAGEATRTAGAAVGVAEAADVALGVGVADGVIVGVAETAVVGVEVGDGCGDGETTDVPSPQAVSVTVNASDT